MPQAVQALLHPWEMPLRGGWANPLLHVSRRTCAHEQRRAACSQPGAWQHRKVWANPTICPDTVPLGPAFDYFFLGPGSAPTCGGTDADFPPEIWVWEPSPNSALLVSSAPLCKQSRFCLCEDLVSPNHLLGGSDENSFFGMCEAVPQLM